MKDIGYASYTTTDNTTVHTLSDTPNAGMAYPATDPWAGGQRPNVAILQALTHDVNWMPAGGTPTAAVGIGLVAGQTLQYNGDLGGLRFCAVTSGAILKVAYFYGQPGGEVA